MPYIFRDYKLLYYNMLYEPYLYCYMNFMYRIISLPVGRIEIKSQKNVSLHLLKKEQGYV